ncbi:MAG: GNAT family N-acetyltransferase [Mailhella sp.]|nr:GNAT family N-acetyltransferase [Mailhella sp.]
MEFLTLDKGSLSWEPELCRRWTVLGSDLRQMDPFACTPAWQLAFHDAFSPEQRLLIELNGASLVSFTEYISEQGGIFLLPIESMWFSGCPVLGPQGLQLMRRAMEACAADHRGIAPSVVVSGVQPGSLFEEELWRNFHASHAFRVYPLAEQRAASLRGGYDGYLSRRSANLRSKLKKAQRRAAARGIAFERHVPSAPGEADALYARMLGVERRSWKGIGECGMAESPSKEFYQTMIRRLALCGDGRVIFATCDGTDIGFVFGGMARAVYRGQQLSYDAAWAPFSVGNLLQAEQIRWLCEENAVRYDMGMSGDPRMAYKQHWAEQILMLRTFILAPR